MDTIGVNDASCIRCGRCVKVCPSQIFVQEKAGGDVTLHKPENCILCGHCVAACPTGSVNHAEFPAERVHAVDYGAPTASNARQLGYTLVTDAAQLRAVTEYTLGIFGTLEKRLLHPLVRPWLSRLVPGVYRYVPVFKRLRREYAEGRDRVLRGATAVLFIHAPRESRFGAEDGNLAYENASLMAEALGVSQIYMGFVLTAVRQDRKAKLAAMLGLGDRRICAVMALGMPQFRYPNYIDRAPAPVTRK